MSAPWPSERPSAARPARGSSRPARATEWLTGWPGLAFGAVVAAVAIAALWTATADALDALRTAADTLTTTR